MGDGDVIMNINNKMKNNVAGIIFFWKALNIILNTISSARIGLSKYYTIVDWGAIIYGVIVLSLLGFVALRQKKRGKVLDGLGILYICYFIIIYNPIVYGFIVYGLISLAALIVAFFLSRNHDGEVAQFYTKSKTQLSIYDEQLRDGILTQEEYDHIMKNADFDKIKK